MRATVIALLGFAFVSPAAAQETATAAAFFVKDGGWTILSGSNGCNAFNRPLEEFNVAPMNAIMLSRFVPQPNTKMRLFYWPGALAKDSEVTVSFDLIGGGTIEYKGFGVSDLMLDIHDGLEDEDIAAIDRSGHVIVRTTGVGNMAFLTGGIQNAAEYLLRCAEAVATQE